jgi:hypothetical protein
MVCSHHLWKLILSVPNMVSPATTHVACIAWLSNLYIISGLATQFVRARGLVRDISGALMSNFDSDTGAATSSPGPESDLLLPDPRLPTPKHLLAQAPDYSDSHVHGRSDVTMHDNTHATQDDNHIFGLLQDLQFPTSQIDVTTKLEPGAVAFPSLDSDFFITNVDNFVAAAHPTIPSFLINVSFSYFPFCFVIYQQLVGLRARQLGIS